MRWASRARLCIGSGSPPAARPALPRALAPSERQRVLDMLHTERVLDDQAPAQVHAALFDEGVYLCSPRTMYRILDGADELKERRNQVARPHDSRPHVSNAHPYSEAQCKTLKYCPAFPERFGALEDARAFGQRFFAWYNHEHHHSGLNSLTPAMVHYGVAHDVRDQRMKVLAGAYAAHPERFLRGAAAGGSFAHDGLD